MKVLAIKILIALAVVTGGVLAFGVGSAQAFTFHLINTNKDSGITIDIHVLTRMAADSTTCFADGGTDAAFATSSFNCMRVQYQTSNLTNNPLGIDDIGYNTPTFNVAATSSPATWSNQTCSDPPGPPTTNCVTDGFDGFMSEVKKAAALDGISTPLFLSLSSSTSVSPNPKGSNFAVHIRFDNSCSLWASDGTTTSISPDVNCTTRRPPGERVPEPSTFALFGTAVGALAAFSNGRRSKHLSA